MAFLWSLVVIDPLFILSTFLCGCVSIPLALIDKTGDSSMRVGRVWARSLLWITGVRVTIEGLEKIDLKRNYLFCSNHLSYMDTPVVMSSIPAQFRFLAKKGLFQIPFLGTHLSQAGHIPVPLEDPRAAVKTMTTAAAVIQRRGISMLIFPEGGRSEDGVLQPFKEGGAFIAIKAGVPLLPIALIGTREVMAMGSPVFHPFRRVTLRIGDPIPTDGFTTRDRGQLTEAVREQIVAMLAKPSETSRKAGLQQARA
jgi:1-acyl-sn-glycerol-3-phosphate acyltransferase